MLLALSIGQIINRCLLTKNAQLAQMLKDWRQHGLHLMYPMWTRTWHCCKLVSCGIGRHGLYPSYFRNVPSVSAYPLSMLKWFPALINLLRLLCGHCLRDIPAPWLPHACTWCASLRMPGLHLSLGAYWSLLAIENLQDLHRKTRFLAFVSLKRRGVGVSAREGRL